MTYTMDLSDGLAVLEGDPQHYPISGRVLVTQDTESRWAEVTCSCGQAAVSRWISGVSTYRELLVLVWSGSCGSRTQRVV